jgi:hypothetical protein
MRSRSISSRGIRRADVRALHRMTSTTVDLAAAEGNLLLG